MSASWATSVTHPCPLIYFSITAGTAVPMSPCLSPRCDWQPNKSHISNHIYLIFLSRAEVIVCGGGLRKRRAGKEEKAPQMKILNQYALLLQLRTRWGLHLIYSPKPGNQAIKRNQTIRFLAPNGPTASCGQPGTWLSPFEQQPSSSKLIYLLTLWSCSDRGCLAQ